MTLFAFLSPATDRAILIVVVGGCYLGYHLYHLWHWWQAKRDKVKARCEGDVARVEDSKRTTASEDSKRTTASEDSKRTTARLGDAVFPSLPPQSDAPSCCCTLAVSPSQGPSHSKTSQGPSHSKTSLSGEAEYAKARVMRHQPIPDSEHDGEYLGLLVKSADLGYARAASKLGEYAMRRACMVEAYYWFSMAKKNGMQNLDRTMQQIRSVWANGGFHRESANEYEQFPHERGSIGYALLCRDSRHNADAAKARLAESAPEFLVGT